MLWDTMVNFFKSWFNYSGVDWYYQLISVVLAIAFGVVWLLGIQPKIRNKLGLLGVMVVAAFLTVLAISFIQVPLENKLEEAIGLSTYMEQILLAGIATVLITGLVQEGAKMVPMVFWWLRSNKTITPKEGLMIGAIAGAGFGIFEAVWVHNLTFMYGWTWEYVNYVGIEALIPFWERFWTVAIHIGLSAIAGYGLAKGKGFQFYLLAAALHGVVNYLAILSIKGILTINQTEICIAVLSALIMLATLWLRWRKDEEGPAIPVEAAEPIETTEPDTPEETDV